MTPDELDLRIDEAYRTINALLKKRNEISSLKELLRITTLGEVKIDLSDAHGLSSIVIGSGQPAIIALRRWAVDRLEKIEQG